MPRLLLFVVLFFASAFLNSAAAQNAEVDLSDLFEGIDLRPSESAFIAPPREVVRPLIRCKKLMAKNEIGEAVEILGELLADDSAEDFLISRGSSSFESLRRRTESILGAIDDKYLEPYRVRYDIRARKLLEQGVAESSPALLQQVSNRFFFTDSGAEAAMLLGHMDLSQGHASSAQSWFAKIVRFPSTANRHDPEASILLATCQLLGNDLVQAKSTLVALKKRLPNSTINFQGKNYPLFNRDQDALPWLTSLIGASPLAANTALSEWLMSQGNPARTGKTGVGLPLLASRWEQPIGDSLAYQNEASTYLKDLVEQGLTPAPASQPLVVKDTVIYRDSERMYGVDFKTGRRQWAWPPQLGWKQNAEDEINYPERAKLYQRLVLDSIYGQASSDGQLIFFVPSPGGSDSNEYSDDFGDATQSAPDDVREFNELVAIDAGRSGSLAWRVGGPSGLDEPKLAKVYFIGEPLPLEGVLYCCCVRDNAIQMVALDSKSGKLRWAQVIASYSGSSFNTNRFRRLAGVSPSYADGKLVCLTGTGGVVAIELATRSLLWGHEFQLPSDARVVGKDYADALTDVWRDSVVAISNGKVFLTPVLSRNLLALNLDDGDWAWFEDDGLQKRVPRNSSLYLAGTEQNQLILVGAKDIRSVNALTGDEKWLLTLPEGDVLTGRGYIGDGLLFVPTASQKIIQVNLQTGRIVDSVATGRILGNLARVEGDVISLGIDHVASFPELGIKEKAFSQLAIEKLNDDQKFVRAQLLVQRGDAGAGLDLLIELAEANAAQQYVPLLKSLVSYFEEADLNLSIKALDAIKKIYPNEDVDYLEESRSLTLLRMGDFEQSATLILDQIEKQFQQLREDDAELPNSLEKTIHADLIDYDFEIAGDAESQAGFEAIENQDREESLQFSSFGWQRVKLLMAVEGLQTSEDAETLTEIRSRIAKLLVAAMDKSEQRFEWLLAQFHERTIDRGTLLEIAQHYLENGNHLTALQYANAAIRQSGSEPAIAQLLKAKILLSGKDGAASLDVLGNLDTESLPAAEQVAAKQLLEDASTQAQSEESSWLLPNSDKAEPLALDAQAIVNNASEISPQNLRASIVPNLANSDRIKDLRFAWVLAGPDRIYKELEIRDRRGHVQRRLQIENNDGRSGIDFGTPFGVEIREQVAEFTLSETVFIVDWFKVISGEGGSLWNGYLGSVSPSHTAMTDGMEYIVFEDDQLTCYQSIDGKRVWSRQMDGTINQITAQGQSVVVWSDENQLLRTFDVATGRLIRTFRSNRAFVKETVGDQFVFFQPVRKGELSAADEDRITGGAEIENPANIGWRYSVFDPALGKLAWEKSFHRDDKFYFLKDEFCVLGTDSTLKCYRLATGELISQVELPFDADSPTPKNFSLQHHSAGWVLQVNYEDDLQYFVRSQSSYWFFQLDRDHSSGPAMLLDESKTKMLWKAPIYLEHYDYAKNQPADSPAIVFGRHVLRRNSQTTVTDYTQFILLEASRGKVIGEVVLENAGRGYQGYTIDWTREKSLADTRLVMSSAKETKTISFIRDPDQPPTPTTYLTFNALDCFEDPAFSKPKSSLVDGQHDALEARAKAADERRRELEERSAAELKKKMGVESQ